MELIELLQRRQSCQQVEAPGPDRDQLEAILRAGLRAPDHGLLRPWRFLVIEGEARERLGQLFLQAGLEDDPDLVPPMRHKLAAMPLRAPLLLIVIARLQSHPKVPDVEQRLSAGAATQNMLLAADALGLGGMWRTGAMAYHPRVRAGLGLADNEAIIAYLYLGSRPAKTRPLPDLRLEDFVSRWPLGDEDAR